MNTNFSEIIAHLSTTRGQYVDGHSGHLVKSRMFAVLLKNNERHVCPLPSFRNGQVRVSTLNPITVNNNVASLSVMALQTLNQKGDSVFDAAIAFNEANKNTGAQILDIFTVL